jgi:hypothetical protein
MHRLVIAAVLAGWLVAPAAAQFEKKVEEKETEEKFIPRPNQPPTVTPSIKAPAAPILPGEVEVNFLNGSTVRMVLQSEKVEVATPYGQLAVPSKDIRAIEFGLHFPEGSLARINQAIKNLGGNDYRERDQAGKTLLELGPFSYPAVFEASRVNDLEISRRAKDLVKQMQKKHPKKDLKTSAEDRIVTPTFTIVGRILTPTINAKAELFGQVELPLASMRQMRALGASQDVDVTIDAAKYASAGQWMETDFVVDGRSTVVVTAKGLVDTWPQQGGQYIVGPNGLQGRGMGMNVFIGGGRKIPGPIQGQMYGGMLIGKIGEDGEAFTIGERYEATPETEGKLYLHIGPSPWNTPSTGSYEVKIARK